MTPGTPGAPGRPRWLRLLLYLLDGLISLGEWETGMNFHGPACRWWHTPVE